MSNSQDPDQRPPHGPPQGPPSGPPLGDPPQGQYTQGQYAQGQFNQSQPPQFAPHQAEPEPSRPKLLAVLSLVAGIIGLLALLFPWVAIAAGAVAVILGVLALVRKHLKGLAIAGTIVGGFAMIFGITVLVLFAVAEAKLSTPAPPPTTAPGTELPVEPGAPSVFEELRSEADLNEFTAVDADTLKMIAADPEAYQEEPIIIYGNMGQPLVHPGLESQQMCVTQFHAYAEPTGEYGTQTNALILDESIDFECPIADRFLGLDGRGLSEEAVATMHKLYVVPAQPMPTEADGDLPAFVLIHAEDIDVP